MGYAAQATYTLVTPPDPALTPPPGVIPTFHQPYTLRPYAELTIATGIIVTSALVLARIYVKARIVKTFLVEDYTCILGWVAYLVYVSFEWHDHVYNNRGVHQWNATMKDVEKNKEDSNYADVALCISWGAIKISILLLIIRIFLTVKRTIFFWIAQVLMYANGIFYFVSLMLNVLSCSPREKIWKPDTPGKCLDLHPLYTTSAAFNTVSDILMLSVPLILVWNLQMNVKRKVGISAVFGSGFLASACAAARIYFQKKLSTSKDYTFINSQTGLLCYGELGFGIICSCLPLLPLFWSHISGGSKSRPSHLHMSPMNGGTSTKRVTNRGTHEDYSPVHSINGATWAKSDRSTAPMFDGVMATRSDEEAIADAVAGIKRY